MVPGELFTEVTQAAGTAVRYYMLRVSELGPDTADEPGEAD